MFFTHPSVTFITNWFAYRYILVTMNVHSKMLPFQNATYMDVPNWVNKVCINKKNLPKQIKIPNFKSFLQKLEIERVTLFTSRTNSEV